MSFPTLPGAATVIAMAVATCSTANATLLTFSDRTTFLAALPSAAESESFEDEALDVSLGSRTIATSSSDIEFIGNASATFGVNDLVAGGRGPTDGTRYLQVGFISTSSVRFQFATPLLAFGIDVVDKNVNDLDGLIDDQTINNAISPGGEGNIQFWGVIASGDMPFTEVGFAGLGPSVPGDTFALDNVVFVTIPEPNSLSLLGLGSLVPLSARRRRKTVGKK